jgi:sulfite exporter TauE/SafE
MAGVAHAATVIAGALMVGWAVSTIAAQRGVAIGTLHAPEAWQRALGRLLHAIRMQPMATRAGLTGLLTTLLPCGWLYVFVAMAGGTGSVRGGLSVMLIFWAGTVPAMLAVGIGAQSVFGPLRKRLPSLSAFAVLVIGVLAISGRLSMRDDHAMQDSTQDSLHKMSSPMPSAAPSSMSNSIVPAPLGAPSHEH